MYYKKYKKLCIKVYSFFSFFGIISIGDGTVIEIRKAYPIDAYEIINIYDIVWKSEFYDVLPNGIIHDRLKNVHSRVEHLTNQIEENNRIFVAVDDGKIVGFCFYARRQDERYADSEEIRSIYVLPSYQNQGIGTKLINACIEEIKRLGYHSFIVDVPNGGRCTDFFLKFGGKKRELFSKKIDGYSVMVDIIIIDINKSNSTPNDEWNELFLMVQDKLYLLNNNNLEIGIILTNKGNTYMGIGIKHRVCPIEVALGNMYLNKDSNISKILILNKNSKPVLPCGKCRDLLISLGEDNAEILFDYGSLKTMTMKELNPYYKTEEKV